MKAIPFGVSLTEKEMKFLEELQDYFGTSNRSEAFRMAIELAYQSINQPNSENMEEEEDENIPTT